MRIKFFLTSSFNINCFFQPIKKSWHLLKFKRFTCFLILLLNLNDVFANYSGEYLSNNVSASESVKIDDEVVAILNKMKESVLNSDYQFYFIAQDTNDYSNTLKYTYLGSKGNKRAVLLYLEGSPREVILHDKMISYFQTDSVSFSISSNYITEVFPDVIYENFVELTQYYDFILLGKARIANRSSQLVRIIPKDKDRYNYVIWIDDTTNLPLRIDLLDQNSKIINQIKVILLNLNFDKKQFDNYLKSRDYPIFYPIEVESHQDLNWQLTWLPSGFKETDVFNIDLHDSNIDTKRFSDGIFSFTINVSEDITDKSNYLSTQGARTVFSTYYDKHNIVVVGNLPIDTIKKIANSVKFY